MDARLILAGQQPDVLNILARSNEAGQQRINFDNQNALTSTLRQNGPGILAGDQNALNALAQFDPQAALGVQSTRLGMDATRQNMEGDLIQRQRNATADSRGDQEWKWKVEEYAANKSAAERAAEAAEIEKAVKAGLAARSPQEWDMLVTQMGADELVGQFGNREAVANQYRTVAEILKGSEPRSDVSVPSGYMLKDPNNPGAGVVRVPGVEDKPIAPYTAEGKLMADLREGRIDEETYRLGLQRLAPKGFEIVSDGKGGVTVREGVSLGAGNSTDGTPKVGPSLAEIQTSVDAATTLIDAIAGDPALSKVTGSLEGGGGNNVDDLNIIQRGYYGGDGLAVIQKVAQLQNTAWLAARDMLKGGGAITDYESKKAEGAMARLSRAQGDAEFKVALQDLKDAITDGAAKLKAAGGSTAGANTVPAPAPITTPGGSVLRFDAEGNMLP